MKWALKKAEEQSDIESRTQAYNIYPIYDKRTVIVWRANQQLELKSTNYYGTIRISRETTRSITC